MASGFKRLDQVGGESALEHDLVGQPLAMQPRRCHRGGDRQSPVDHVTDHLQYRRDDAAAAGRAGDKERSSLLEQDGRRHRRERTFGRSGRVCLSAGKAERIGGVRLGREIIELVIEQNPGAIRDKPDAVAEIERGGVGHRIAEAVDHRKMRGAR